MLDGLAEYGYWGLLLASFLAATVLPFSSEVVFAALIAAGLDSWQCILFATLGNAAGGATCYYLGRLGKTEWLEKWFRRSAPIPNQRASTLVSMNLKSPLAFLVAVSIPFT